MKAVLSYPRTAVVALILAAAPLAASDLAQAAKEQKEYEKKLQETRAMVPAYGIKGTPLAARAEAAKDPARETGRLPARSLTQPLIKEEERAVDFQIRSDALRREIERLQKEVDELSTVNGRHAEYSFKKSRLERLKADMVTLEEAARKKNIPSGYIR